MQSLGWPPTEVKYFINCVICFAEWALCFCGHRGFSGSRMSGICCACVSPKQLWRRQFLFFAHVWRVYLLMKCLVTSPIPLPSFQPTVCAGRGWVLLCTSASCNNSFQRFLCHNPVCVTPSFVSCFIARMYDDTGEPFCFPPSSATATHRVTHRWKVLMRIVLVYWSSFLGVLQWAVFASSM